MDGWKYLYVQICGSDLMNNIRITFLYCLLLPKLSYSQQVVNGHLRLQLHGVIYRPDSFVLMLRYCANLKAMRYESTSLNRIVADKSHRVIAA